MSDALQALVPRTPKRPPGVTPRQWRLAAIYPKARTAYEAMLAAGYAPLTADRNSAAVLSSIGYRRAYESQAKRQADSATGLASLAARSLDLGAAKLKELSTVEQLQFGLQATKQALEAGENLDLTGDADAWRRMQVRAIRRGFRLGVATSLAYNVARTREKALHLLEKAGLTPHSLELTQYPLSDASPQPPR